MFRTLFLAFIVLVSFPSLAHESEAGTISKIDIRGVGRLDYQPLFTEMSTEGETLDAFVVRIAPRLRAYSDETGFEACGVLATDGEKFSIVVGTNFGYMVCVNSSTFVVDGFRHAGATLHTHGRQGRFTPSRADRLLMAESFAGQRASLAVVHGQALNAFSDADIRSGAGYLAGSDGRVFYQSKGTYREVTPP